MHAQAAHLQHVRRTKVDRVVELAVRLAGGAQLQQAQVDGQAADAVTQHARLAAQQVPAGGEEEEEEPRGRSSESTTRAATRS